MFCKNCGEAMNENQAICLKCGVKAGTGSAYCPNCGHETGANAVICVGCGVALAKPDDQGAGKGPESKFTGGLLGLIGISLLQGLIIAFTLGIAAPWAVCLYQNWLADHTIIDGHQVKFDGTGGQLFGNYIKWLLLSLVTCGIYSLWLSINMQKWITKHTHLV